MSSAELTIEILDQRVLLNPQKGSVYVGGVYEYSDKMEIYQNLRAKIGTALILFDTTAGNMDMEDFDRFVKTGGHARYVNIYRKISSVMRSRESVCKSHGVSGIEELHSKTQSFVASMPPCVIYVVEPLYGSYFAQFFRNDLETWANLGMYWVVVGSETLRDLESSVGNSDKSFALDKFSYSLIKK